MKSLDTNILLYAADEDCVEHAAAIRLVTEALRSPAEWMLSDQVLFEMYAGLRHPGVFAKPLPAAEAARRVAFLRVRLCQLCGDRLHRGGRFGTVAVA